MRVNSSKSSLKIIKSGSLVRVILPAFEGKLAMGVVSHFQVVITDAGITTLIWVDMILDGHTRPFEPENLELIPRFSNGFDNSFIADLVTEKAA
ncbi:MAG: hypothetical protein PHO76_02650 [Methylotenera sp.]|nr:hypothetical protein [Methylotenera sp.]MDD4927243.1 hypothetical protein [Methylotenera sp.]